MPLPPGPKTPALLQMAHWILNPFSLMDRYAQAYGDCFTVRVAQNMKPMVFLSHPQDLQLLLTQDEAKLFDTPGELNDLFEPFLGPQSVIALSGDRHRRMRQLMMPPFHGERMRSYGHLIQEITETVMQAWPLDRTFPLRESMQLISMRVILSAVFGLAEGPRYQQLETLLGNLLNNMSNPISVSLLYFPVLRQDWGSLSPWGRFVRQRQAINDLIYAEIAERRSHPDANRSDILSLLMSARDEAGNPMTDAELRDELMTLLLAGHETTATALTWALYWIHQNPPVRTQLLQELREFASNPDPSDLFRLPYLNAVCCETLRIYPVGMLTFPRVVRSPVTFMGQTVDPGTVVIGSIYLAHRRPERYPQPNQFDPDRFLNEQFSPFEYLPFGGGNRRCVGMAFAQFEMKVVLGTILRQCELAIAETPPVKPQRRGLTAGPTLIRMQVQA